ncbi:Alcohol dehydrogenase [NADP(+)] [Toxocara canis]|uniref:Alcohol dehydrogenase [NADP(+)] n=1 Tax=Toxocara canis TaxID=6265 RepID=A0A0B2W1U8_TOXCA|nr:Alcohol dehydrogenase [NADP(+)] [Toxocara canis]
MVKVDCLTLPTGAKLPLLGLGTWLAKDEEQLHTAIKAAIDAGYRLFDTAFLYETEAGVGNALNDCIQSGKVKREELFITTKLPFTAHSPSDVEKVVAQQLRTLKVDYIDLYLIHCPCATKHKTGSFAPLVENGSFAVDNVDLLDTWRALEELCKQGKLKAIGLSNFNEEQIQRIYDHAEIKPHNLQVEAHLYFPQKELQEFCKLRNITMTAYAPLGSPGRKVFRPNGFWPEGEPLKDPVVSVIASKHKKTPAQILLKFLVQRGISAVPKSTNLEHIRENVDIFDFLLDSDDFIKLDRIEHRVRLFIFDYFGHHPCYPMKDQDTTKFEKVVFESF